MLKWNMQQVYIDEDWVVSQYMSLQESKGWEAEETHEDNQVQALEHELYIEEIGIDVWTLPVEVQDKETPKEVLEVEENNKSDSNADIE